MTRKPIQFRFEAGFDDYPTVLYGWGYRRPLMLRMKSTDSKPTGTPWAEVYPPDDDFWIHLGFSKRLDRDAHATLIERVFNMGRRQVPPWLVVKIFANESIRILMWLRRDMPYK